jgi:hypothetical protein
MTENRIPFTYCVNDAYQMPCASGLTRIPPAAVEKVRTIARMPYRENAWDGRYAKLESGNRGYLHTHLKMASCN